MKSHDAIVIGAGVIGLSIAWRLQKSGLRIQVLERGEAAREASHAAAGMIAVYDPHNDAALQPLAERSALLYPDFVRDLARESGAKIDFRSEGTITFLDPTSFSQLHAKSRAVTAEEIARLEPHVVPRQEAYYLPESCVDPRQLCTALLQAFRENGGDLATGSPVRDIAGGGDSFEVKTEQTVYAAPVVINCAGAWAGQFGSPLPTRPVKGQMLSVVPVKHPEQQAPVLRHVVRAPEVYLVPRSDGRIIIGSTLEEAGFDKHVDPAVIQRLHHEAAALCPPIGDMRIHEAWAGLRPGSPDGRPLIGKLEHPNLLVATGHYRDGILLAPVTAEIVAALVHGQDPGFDMRPFAPNRFQR